MLELVESLRPEAGFLPHIHCYLGRPALVWTMFATDLLIGIAYVAIAVTLFGLVRRVRLAFNAVVLNFGTFIAACGGTHLLDVWTLWRPDYWWSAAVRVVTALASIGTGIYLFRLRDRLVALAEASRLAEERRGHLEELAARLEQRVEERTRRLQLALDATALGTWEYQPAQQQVKWDPPLERMFGFAGGTFGGTYQDFAACVHPDDRAGVEAELCEALRGGTDFAAEYRIVRPDGEVRWINSRGRAALDAQGGAASMIGTALDVTERRGVEQALHAAVRARDQFIAAASHELKTPLTSMAIQLQLVERGLSRLPGQPFDPASAVRSAEVFRRQLRRLTQLVDGMLDISRLSRGTMEWARAPHELGELVAAVIERTEREVLAAGSALTSSIEPGIRGDFDSARVGQAIANLILNAARYGGGRPIEVTVRRGPAAGRAQVVVRDHGPGVAEEAQARIFDRFERAVSDTGKSGLGLGLYIVRSVVEAHGGSVTLESRPGEGARFTVELPVDAGGDGANRGAPRPS